MLSWFRLGLLVGVVCSLAVTGWTQAAPRTPSKVMSVTAKLYYSDRGTFSDNILDRPDLALWNTIIGEGGSGGASVATLIEVEVAGEKKPAIVSTDRLTITVQQKGKPPITRRIDPIYLGSHGEHFEAVWLYDSGCLPVTISVQLNNQPPIRKKIDFDCGE